MTGNEMNINDAREQLYALAVHAERCGSVTYLLGDNGNRLAAIVHHEIGEAWERIEAEEDELWSEHVAEELRKVDSGEETPIPLDEVLRDLDLDDESNDQGAGQ